MSVSFEEYQARDAVNFSTLKHMVHSPKHYQHACKVRGADSAGRLKGRGTHTAVLEPDRFTIDYALFKPEPGKDKAIRRGERWEAFKAMHAEENILKLDEYEHCLSAARAVREDPLAKEILARTEKEQSIEWIDEDTGIRCKSRLDMIGPDGIWDLKGVRSTDSRVISLEVARMMYHAQLAWYQEGVKRARGLTLGCYLMCVEHAAPHDVAVNDAGGEEAIYQGWESCRLWLNRVAECRASGKWPGRYDEIQKLSLPAYIWPDDEQVMSANEVNDYGEAISG